MGSADEHHDDHHEHLVTLSSADAQALERLAGAGFDPARIDGAHPARAERLLKLLNLLDTPCANDQAQRDTLIDVTLARIARSDARAATEPAAGPFELCADDADALDAWVLSGYDAQEVPAWARERVLRHERLADVATAAVPVDGSARAALVARTLSTVDDADSARVIPIEDGRKHRFGVRWSDLISVAAVCTIAASVIWPVATAARQRGMRTDCQANLGLVASAVGRYAGDNRDSLPIAAAGFGGTWWNVGAGAGRSNSENLYTLVRERYSPLLDLACPGNPRARTVEAAPDARDWKSLDEISYSYQIMFGPHRPGWHSPSRVVLIADRSPVVVRAIRGELIRPTENSPNHNGFGQDVLWSDGAVNWTDSPVVENGADGNNIWLPAQIEEVIRQLERTGKFDPLKGSELPASAQDSFVGP